LLALLLFVMGAVPAFAQIQQAWVAKYDNGIPDGNHQALKMALDASGNIYVLGVSQNANTNTGYVVVKYAPNGNQVWAARYDSTNFPSATPTGFAVDSGSNIVVTGRALTVKFDANGNLLWTAPYNGAAIAVDPAQNIYITGVSSKFTTMSFNPAGSNLWTKTETFKGLGSVSEAIAIDSFTNIYVGGTEIYYSDKNLSYNELAVKKYDAKGNLLWGSNESALIGAGPWLQIAGFIVDSYGNVYSDFNGDPVFAALFGTSKIDSDGSTGWYQFDPTGNEASYASGLVIDTMGNVVVTGHDGYPSSFGTYKIDTNGNYVWTNLYLMSSYGGGAALALAVDSANNIYVTGESSITNTPYDIATLKLDANGNQLWVQRYRGPGLGNAGNAIAVDNSGNVYVAGYETETNGFTSMILIKYSPVTLQQQSSGNVVLQTYGSPGENFDVQMSTNLQTWQDLGPITADTNGLLQFIDTNAPLFPARFYYTIPK
jgi:hypothetical protein